MVVTGATSLIQLVCPRGVLSAKSHLKYTFLIIRKSKDKYLSVEEKPLSQKHKLPKYVLWAPADTCFVDQKYNEV